MEDVYMQSKLELVTDKLLTFVLVLLSVVQAILTSLILFTVLLPAPDHAHYFDIRPRFLVMCNDHVSSGMIKSLPLVSTSAALKEGDFAEYALTLSCNAGIYVMFSAPLPSLCTSPPSLIAGKEIAMKPFCNPDSGSADEFFLIFSAHEWSHKIGFFSQIFSDMMRRGVLEACAASTTLCIGAGKGDDVLALMEMGISNLEGNDWVAWPPLVMKGDMESLPFPQDTFDFEFSMVFDHSRFTSQLATEIARTLKPGAYMAIHLMLKTTRGGHQMPTNRMQRIDAMIGMFGGFEVVHIGDTDAYNGGLDTEVMFRKPFTTGWGM